MSVKSEIPYFGPALPLEMGFDVIDDMLDVLPEAGLLVDLQKKLRPSCKFKSYTADCLHTARINGN